MMNRSDLTNHGRRRACALLVLGVGGLFVIGTGIWKARTQSAIVQAIRDAGGRVYYPYQILNEALELENEPLLKRCLRRVLGRDYVYSVSQVNLDGTHVSDDTVRRVAMLRKLPCLNLSSTTVSDASLAILRDLDRLEELNLEGTTVSDAGIANLSDCERLSYLWLRGTHVTDRAIQHLRNLRDLRRLDIRRTSITEAGVKELVAAFPRADIYHEALPESLARVPWPMRSPIKAAARR